MNITPHLNPTPISTVINPPTDSLRRENDNRQVIAAPTGASGSAAEKGVGDKDKGKSSAQTNEQFDFVELRKKAEENDNRINNDDGQNSDKNAESDSEQSAEQNAEQNPFRKEESTSDENKQEEIVEEKQIQVLQARDQEVRTHEMAHAAVGGSFAGAPSYTYETGPDNKKYAVAGEVSISVSPIEGDPKATIDKMEQVHAAALAPAEPSTQDRKVAAQASQIMVQARGELATLSQETPDDENQSEKISESTESNETSKSDTKSKQESELFDTQINNTLSAQEALFSTASKQRSDDVNERATRIEGHYSSITQAHNKTSPHQFQLTA